VTLALVLAVSSLNLPLWLIFWRLVVTAPNVTQAQFDAAVAAVVAGEAAIAPVLQQIAANIAAIVVNPATSPVTQADLNTNVAALTALAAALGTDLTAAQSAEAASAADDPTPTAPSVTAQAAAVKP
jgi:hypothetical protein